MLWIKKTNLSCLLFSLYCQYLLIAALALPVLVVLIQCKDGETFFNFDEEGFVEDALYQLKCVLKYDRVFRMGDEV